MGRAWDNPQSTEVRRTTLRALGLQMRELFGRSSQQCQWRMRNYAHETCVVSFKTQWHSSACPLRSRCISFAWNWWHTPVLEVPRDVRGATARDDRTPSARLLDETPETIHAHSGQWLDKMCTLCSRRSLAQAPCTHQKVQVQRKTLREPARCPQRQMLALRTQLAHARCTCRCSVHCRRRRNVLIHWRK